MFEQNHEIYDKWWFMLASQRIEKIKDLLLKYKHVDLTMLTSVLSVSEATIRRDLEKLELTGFSKRTHGGAVMTEDSPVKESLSEPEISNLEQKQQIGYIASKLVDNNEVIFLGSGTTCLQLTKHLKHKKNLTIVTNNVGVCTEFYETTGVKVILTGGDLHFFENRISMVGDFAHKMLQNIYVSKAFFSVDGVDLDYGYSILYNELKLIWDIVVPRCQELIIVADYTKFNKKAFIPLAPLKSIHKIVTNEEAPEEYKKYFYEHNIPIYTSYKLTSNTP